MMEMTVEHVQGTDVIAILGLHGALDASNYMAVVAKAGDLYAGGARRLLLDMREMSFMSSSGVVALHSIIRVFRGEQPHDPEAGWEAFHAIDRDRSSGIQPYVKILNPQPKVFLTLQKTGMDQFCEIHKDLSTALSTF
jgi:anti-anti-sigma regulatory factor